MIRKDIIDKFAERGYTKADADVILDDVVAIITEALVAGEEVHLHGFGTFSVQINPGRNVYNLQTGEEIYVPPFKRPKFTPGKILRRSVKEGVIRE